MFLALGAQMSHHNAGRRSGAGGWSCLRRAEGIGPCGVMLVSSCKYQLRTGGVTLVRQPPPLGSRAERARARRAGLRG